MKKQCGLAFSIILESVTLAILFVLVLPVCVRADSIIFGEAASDSAIILYDKDFPDREIEVDGAVYDSELNTLTLTDFQHPEKELRIGGLSDDFSLKVEGICELRKIDVYAGSLTVTGNGCLTVNEEKITEPGIDLYSYGTFGDRRITIDNSVSVRIYGSTYAIKVYDSLIADGQSAIAISRDGIGEIITAEQPKASKKIKGVFYVDDGYVGDLIVNSSDPNTCYSGNRRMEWIEDDNAPYNEELGENGYYRRYVEIERYLYSDYFSKYILDEDFGKLELTTEEFENSEYSFKLEDDYEIEFSAGHLEFRDDIELGKDADGNVYAFCSDWDEVFDYNEASTAFYEDTDYLVLLHKNGVDSSDLTPVPDDAAPQGYNHFLNTTDLVLEGTSSQTPIDISGFEAALSGTTFTFTGKAITPEVVVEGLNIEDYTVEYQDNTNAGTATVVITGTGNYTGTITRTFEITKAANPLKIKAKTATVRYSKVKSKSQTLAVSKVITFTKKGQGKMTYTRVSGSKKITINKSTGKVTVKKGLKKGTYKIKVKVKADGNNNYNASGIKTVTFKVVIK